jgi:hypothetical protein
VQSLKNFPASYGTRRIIIAFTRAFHLFLSRARSFQFIPSHSICPTSTVILSTQIRLDLPSGRFPLGFPTINIYAFPFSPILATCPDHILLFALSIPIILGLTIIIVVVVVVVVVVVAAAAAVAFCAGEERM